MPQHSTQKKQVTPVPKVRTSERVSKSVKRTAGSLKSKTPAKKLEVPQDVPLRQSGSIPRSEQIPTLFLAIPPKALSQLNTEGNCTLFIPFASHGQKQIIEVYLLTTKGEDFFNTKPAIKRYKYKNVKPSSASSPRFMMDEKGHLLRRKNR